MEYEWDAAKALTNLEKHGLDFREAVLLFDGRPLIIQQSDRAGEDRFQATSRLNGRFVTLVWTNRSGKIRVISFRRARDNEQRAYRELHGG